MKTYTRAVALFAVLLAGVISLIALATPGSAAPYVASISAVSPVACNSDGVTGSGFTAGSTVTLTLSPGGQVVGTATVDSNGAFSTTAHFPSSVKGSRLIVANDGHGKTASTRVRINTDCGVAGESSSRANPTGSSSSSSGTEGLSATGVAVWTIGGLGVLLLVAGALFTFGGRRGRRA